MSASLAASTAKHSCSVGPYQECERLKRLGRAPADALPPNSGAQTGITVRPMTPERAW